MEHLYDALTPWYHLLDPASEHAEECESYEAALLDAIVEPAARPTLLELGSGAGNNASHLAGRFRCTLSDLSPGMLALSRAKHPKCEHVLADMRSLRLGRTFDAVLVHDAVMYMKSEADLRAAAATAYAHTAPGGAALFAPDDYADDFEEQSVLVEGDDGDRALRVVEWSWDPDPSDCTFRVEYVCVLRHDGKVTTVHETHIQGLFSRKTWERVLEEVGFTVGTAERRHHDEVVDLVHVCTKP